MTKKSKPGSIDLSASYAFIQNQFHQVPSRSQQLRSGLMQHWGKLLLSLIILLLSTALIALYFALDIKLELQSEAGQLILRYSAQALKELTAPFTNL